MSSKDLKTFLERKTDFVRPLLQPALSPPPFTFAFINISRVTYQRNNSSTKNGNPVKQEIQSWVWPIFLNCLSPCQNSSLHLHFQGNTLFWTIQMQNMKCNLISEKAPALQNYVSKNYKRKLCWTRTVSNVLMKLYLSGIFVYLERQ